jgi:hypothetical protein
MLLFLGKLVLIYVVLAIGLYVLARFVHNLLYTDIPPSLNWRAPVAAAAIWLLGLGLPLLLNQTFSGKWPITFNDIFLPQSARKTLEFKEFIVPGEGGRQVTYTRKKNTRGLIEYQDEEGRPLPAATSKLTGITTDGEKIAFQREVEKKSRLGTETTTVRFVSEDQKLVMPSEEFGTISSSGFGQFFLSLFGALITLATWFLALWLLLLIQWPHALGIAIPVMLGCAFAMNFVL